MTSEEVRDILVEFGFTAHIRSRGEEAQAIKAAAHNKGAALGGRADPCVDEPFSAHLGALGQKAGTLSGLSAFCLCPDRLSGSRVIRSYLGKSIGKSICELLSTVAGIGAHCNASRCGLLWPEDHVQKSLVGIPHMSLVVTRKPFVFMNVGCMPS